MTYGSRQRDTLIAVGSRAHLTDLIASSPRRAAHRSAAGMGHVSLSALTAAYGPPRRLPRTKGAT